MFRSPLSDTEVSSQNGSDSISQPFGSLRMSGITEDIHSTSQLVAAFNNASDSREKDPLRTWLSYYLEWFVSQPDSALTEGAVMEYAAIANICPERSSDMELLKMVCFSLDSRATCGRVSQKSALAALIYVLEVINEQVFEASLTEMRDLAAILTGKLKSEDEQSSDKDKQRLLLLTLLQLQQRLRRYARSHDWDELLSNLSRYRLVQNNYEYVYQLRLSEMEASESFMDEWLPSLRHGTSIMLRANKASRELAVDYIESGVEIDAACAICKAFCDRPRQIYDFTWHRLLRIFTLANLAAIKNPAHLAVLNNCFDVMVTYPPLLNQDDERRLLWFGVIEQLKIASTDNAPEIRQSAISKLIHLASYHSVSQLWKEDGLLFDHLLTAFETASCYPRHRRRLIIDLQARLSTFDGKDFYTSIIRRWSGGQPIEKKLVHWNTGYLESQERLFTIILNARQSHLTREMHQSNISDLKMQYQQRLFAEVPAGIDDAKTLHVKNLNHTLIFHSDEDDRPWERGEGLKILGTDLPKRIKHVMGVLLVTGNPGTGKTSLVKRIAYDWASTDSYGEEYKLIFVLLMKRLKEGIYDDRSFRFRKRLDTAIANECFSHKTDADYDTLLKQINNALQEPTTLLILDGLEERDNVGANILRLALNCRCKVLLLTRPSNPIDDGESKVTNAVCIGLSQQQFVDFVDTQLSNRNVERLQSFVDKHPTIKSISRIPINAEFLCALWDEAEETSEEENNNFCLAAVLSQLVMRWWDRFAENKKNEPKVINRNELFDILGRIALCASDGEQRNYPIKSDCIRKHAKEGEFRTALRESGFLLPLKDSSKQMFVHEGFRDYFAGRYLAVSLVGNEDDGDKTLPLLYLSKHKFSPLWETIILVAMREACEARDLTGFDEMFSNLDREPKDILGIHDIFLKLNLLEMFFSAADGISREAVTDNENENASDLIDQILNLISAAEHDLETLAEITDRFRDMPQVCRSYPWLLESILEEEADKLKSEHVRRLPLLARVLKYFPESQREMLQKVTVVFNKKPEIRKIVLDQISSLVSEAPDSLKMMLKIIEKSLTDVDLDVRTSAIRQLGQLVNVAEKSIAELMAIIEAANQHGDVHVKCAALDMAANVVKAFPEMAPQMLEYIWKWRTEDEEPLRRASAIHLLSSIVQVAPDQEQACMELLETALVSSLEEERLAVVSEINNISRAIPNCVNYWCGLLEIVSSDTSIRVRKAAAAQTGSLASLITENADSLLRLVDKFVRQEPAVRAVVVGQTARIAQALPEQATSLLDLATGMCLDENEHVRRNALEQILDPSLHSKTDVQVKLLEQAWISDPSCMVRELALAKMADLLIAAPEYIGVLCVYFQEGMSCPDEDTSMAARHALNKLPINSLIDIYWRTGDQCVANILAQKFISVAAVVEKAKASGCSKLVIQDTTHLSSIELERQSAEIEALVEQIRACIALKYPNWFWCRQDD